MAPESFADKVHAHPPLKAKFLDSDHSFQFAYCVQHTCVIWYCYIYRIPNFCLYIPQGSEKLATLWSPRVLCNFKPIEVLRFAQEVCDHSLPASTRQTSAWENQRRAFHEDGWEWLCRFQGCRLLWIGAANYQQFWLGMCLLVLQHTCNRHLFSTLLSPDLRMGRPQDLLRPEISGQEVQGQPTTIQVLPG